MFLLDATIINIALPTIQQAMRLSGPALEWMVTAYSVPFGGLLLLGGRSGDILGKRRVFTRRAWSCSRPLPCSAGWPRRPGGCWSAAPHRESEPPPPTRPPWP